jgi:hypothetical protein
MGWVCAAPEKSGAMRIVADTIDRAVSGGAATGGGPECARCC